jgi:hypothetical protein
LSTLFIKGKKIIYKEKTFELSDMFDNDLLEKCNNTAEKYESNLCITNEVFLSWVQPYNAMNLFFSRFDIKSITLIKPDKELTPLIIDYAKSKNIEVKGTPFFYSLKNSLFGYLNIILTAIYLVLRMLIIPKSDELTSNKENISLIRSAASKKKLSFLKDVDFRYEDYRDTQSIYRSFYRREKILWVIISWISSYKEIKKYKNYISKAIGPYSTNYSLKYYSKRIVHTILYSIIVDKFLGHNKGKKFYTGNNLDRFALIEESIAKKYNLKVICIPHGLEYGFKLPHNFIGDEFYTTSLNASVHLNDLYKTNKFIYNQKIASMMFSVNFVGDIKEKKVIFFTEPREVMVNLKIIEELLPLLKEKNIKLHIKLHPKDKKGDYDKYLTEVEFIDSFDESVTNNICISRKSTTLLESVYNNSDAAAIITNTKDKIIFNTFPSLQDDRISVFFSTKDLFGWIIEKNIISQKLF